MQPCASLCKRQFSVVQKHDITLWALHNSSYRSSGKTFYYASDILRSPSSNRLAGLVVKASASGAEDPGFESRLRRDFSRYSHTSDLKNDTPVLGLVSPVSVNCDWVR